MRKIQKIIFAFICVLSWSYSHDYWLYPKKFVLSKDDTLIVHLYVGDRLKVEIDREFQPEMTERFEVITRDSALSLLTHVKNGDVPILNKKFELNGLGLIVMDRGWAHIEMSRREFEEYLRHEDIKDVKLHRTAKKKVERERYRRYIKSLVAFPGGIDSDIYNKIVGQRLEIILLKNPFLLKVGDTLEVKILFEGKPLSKRTIMLYSLIGDEVFEQKAVTNESGLARFVIKNSGFHLVRLVYLRKCVGCKNVDWESFWASFSFKIPYGD